MISGLVYRHPAIYQNVMKLLYGAEYSLRFKKIAELIPPHSSVVDLCCGDGQLAQHLGHKNTQYLGLDTNAQLFVMPNTSNAQFKKWTAFEDEIPEADVICLVSSLYHFHHRAEELVGLMRAKAKKMVIISEPYKNLSHINWANPIIARLTAVNGHNHSFRFDEVALRSLAGKFQNTDVIKTARELILVMTLSEW